MHLVACARVHAEENKMRYIIIAVVAVPLLCASAIGVPVDPVAPSGIAAICSSYGGDLTYLPPMLLCTNGDIWLLHSNGTWVHGAPGSLPVAVSEVADWGPRHVRLHNGSYYVFTYPQVWQLVGGASVAVPCPPTTADEAKSLGSVKTQYR